MLSRCALKPGTGFPGFNMKTMASRQTRAFGVDHGHPLNLKSNIRAPDGLHGAVIAGSMQFRRSFANVQENGFRQVPVQKPRAGPSSHEVANLAIKVRMVKKTVSTALALIEAKGWPHVHGQIIRLLCQYQWRSGIHHKSGWRASYPFVKWDGRC